MYKRQNLGGADLSECNLSHADLTEAYLGGAKMLATNFSLSLIHISEPTRPY